MWYGCTYRSLTLLLELVTAPKHLKALLWVSPGCDESKATQNNSSRRILMVQTATGPVIINLTGDTNAEKGIIVPNGGKLLIVKTCVRPAWEWFRMLRGACPDYQSPDIDNSIVADLYRPELGEPKDCYVYGLNFGHEIPNTQPAVDWGKKLDNLSEATPRHIYSVARDVPDLNRRIGVSSMGLISPKFVTVGGERRVCGASFRGDRRGAYLSWFDSEWFNRAWFAFFGQCPSA
jgi:hypothetical protein